MTPEELKAIPICDPPYGAVWLEDDDPHGIAMEDGTEWRFGRFGGVLKRWLDVRPAA